MKSLEIFLIFLKIGSFTFGGGLAMIPLIHREIVDNKKLITEEEMTDIFAVAQSAPGVIAINSAIFVGKKIRGIKGAFAAAFGVTLPAFVSILVILILLKNLRENIYVEKIMKGIKAASAGLIFMTALKMTQKNVKTKKCYFIFSATIFIIAVIRLNAAFAVIFGGVAGYIWRNKE